MAEVTDIKVIKQAAGAEMALARKRIAELEGQVRTQTESRRMTTRAIGWLLLLALLVVVVVGSAAAAHRLLLWGWP